MGFNLPSDQSIFFRVHSRKSSLLTEFPQSILLLLGDILVGIVVASLSNYFLRFPGRAAFDWTNEFIWLGIWILWRAYQGLYPGYGRSPQTELRLHTVGTVQLLIIQLAAAFTVRQFDASVLNIILAWSTILVVSLPLRYILRSIMIRLEFYGRPVTIE